ncbi:ABC transporter permease [Ramlibacter tataouinensis]|uniref:ABC transporter permease n=1 Tax=Ramlibacter tataouinensis TaxID=94132 RepID=UPI0022F3CEC3|nr:ABC transporter permease [Ramlibacter tataouinensis]WBY02770.1 ABC transporter permease [Ramlibacter tataouinensis]
MQFVVRRLSFSVITILGVAFIVVSLTKLLPGDPARVIAGVQADQVEVERIRAALRLDDGLLQQYVHFISNLIQGNLGTSARTARPVTEEIVSRLPYTIELATVAVVVGTILGAMLGVTAAVYHRRWPDLVASSIAVLTISVPGFWLALMLILTLSVDLRWFPTGGAESASAIVLPAATLATFTAGLVARMTRAAMLDVLRQDYVRTGYAKGLRHWVVVYKHALRNAAIPIVTVIGLQLGALMGGAIIVETVFSWPGIGRLLIQSITARDFPMMQGIVFIFAAVVVVVNLLTDLVYAVIDPRIVLND